MIKRTLLFGKPAYLSTRDQQLLITYPSDTKAAASVPIEDIGLVVLEHPQITLTHTVLQRLISHQVAVVSCDSRRMPTGLFMPLEGHTEQSERARKQAGMSLPLKKNLWQQTIKAKIANQATHLELAGQNPKKLRRWAAAVKSGDSEHHEAVAAAYYFQHIFGVEGFTRNDKTTPPNHLLNYGYAILRSITARALTASGMLPLLGIHHRNKYNAYCLADDIMEPYRVYVDLIVRQLVDSGTDYSGELTTEHKKQLLQILTIDVQIDGKKSPLMVAMSRTTNSLYECIEGPSRKILFPEL